MPSGPLPLLATGRTADVYAVADTRVLRRYRDGWDVATEAAIMNHVRAHGFPAPDVYRAEGAELEMERLDGPTMVHALLHGQVDVDTAGRILADLHAGLHGVPPLHPAGAGSSVVHLDLHPDNVILTASGPYLIDWCNAGDGPPDLDVALSALILAQVAISEEMSVAVSGGASIAATARELVEIFVACVGGQPGAMLDHAVTLRTADPQITKAERLALTAAAALVDELASA
ncbi:serine/threonine protein kinase [Actinobacteria bacterium YIM 96077]|uniref:Serine/threonine protein kinase n=1 Tax=Phytoactinopolyspora halophila TaxID=1981511 RepID=A0A329QGK4_9ACTN|nr:phosphotransferase [Phytoactinopolyspora halophila]AYY12502.1 serine/threonine protein kinase [Actinobacteria bacterium YIM 96077]RAW09438.1 serine/threonine protein kinase [Phytoactinopolyspora halophila]